MPANLYPASDPFLIVYKESYNVIALFNICLVYLAVNSETEIKRLGYEHKVEATSKMEEYLVSINKESTILIDSLFNDSNW